MSNPLFTAHGPTNPMQQIMTRLDQFRKTVTGDPRQQVQQLLNSGRISQQQYNQAVQIANQLQQMIKR